MRNFQKNVFKSSSIYYKSLEDRKRPSTLTEEPARKQFKFQIPNNDGGKTEADKNNAQSKLENTALKNKRCLSGNVKQILKLNKDFPGLDGFYEVYGKFTAEVLITFFNLFLCEF